MDNAVALRYDARPWDLRVPGFQICRDPAGSLPDYRKVVQKGSLAYFALGEPFRVQARANRCDLVRAADDVVQKSWVTPDK